MFWRRLILLALLPALLTGCAALELSSLPPSRSDSLKRMDAARIQSDTTGFADRFVTTMTGVYDELERQAPTSAAKDAAHQLKTDLALGAISNAVNPRPVAGLMDMVVFVTLLRQIADDSWTAQTFGSATATLTETLRSQEADIRTVARRYLTDAQLDELSELSDQWHRVHLGERAVSHVHLADLPEANKSPRERRKGASSVFGLLFFDPTANLDPAVREIQLSRAASERMFFYLQRMPLLLQLQAESFYRRLLDAPEARRALSDVSAVATSTTRFADASARFADSVEKFPQQFSDEREQALGQLASETTRQREAMIEQMRAALRQEQQNFVSNLEAATNRSTNRLLQRLVIWMLILLASGLVALHVYRRLRGGSGGPGQNGSERIGAGHDEDSLQLTAAKLAKARSL